MSTAIAIPIKAAEEKAANNRLEADLLRALSQDRDDNRRLGYVTPVPYETPVPTEQPTESATNTNQKPVVEAPHKLVNAEYAFLGVNITGFVLDNYASVIVKKHSELVDAVGGPQNVAIGPGINQDGTTIQYQSGTHYQSRELGLYGPLEKGVFANFEGGPVLHPIKEKDRFITLADKLNK